MNNMIGKLQWFDKDGDGTPDIEEDVAIEVTTVQRDGCIQIGYPDGKGTAYLDFSLRDLIEQVMLKAGDDA